MGGFWICLGFVSALARDADESHRSQSCKKPLPLSGGKKTTYKKQKRIHTCPQVHHALAGEAGSALA